MCGSLRHRASMLIQTIFAGLLLLLPAASGPTHAESPATRPAAERLRALHTQRVAVFQRASELSEQLYTRGRLAHTTVLQAQGLLAEARVDAAQTHDEKIQALKLAIETATKHEQLTKERFKAGISTEVDCALSEGNRLKLEIALLKEEEGL